MSRDLNDQEKRVLHIIQAHYGPHNSANDLMWDGSEAVLWIPHSSGERVMVVNLTNLAAWRADGTIETEQELRDMLLIDEV